eukprot:PLAT2328.2.p1 GENE.PLAT2328.2~~PLAT2328.2.p1  ORF type:complete len:427 (-),score=132.42 PLAT2328.2:115-1395(-)
MADVPGGAHSQLCASLQSFLPSYVISGALCALTLSSCLLVYCLRHACFTRRCRRRCGGGQVKPGGYSSRDRGKLHVALVLSGMLALGLLALCALSSTVTLSTLSTLIREDAEEQAEDNMDRRAELPANVSRFLTTVSQDASAESRQQLLYVFTLDSAGQLCAIAVIASAVLVAWLAAVRRRACVSRCATIYSAFSLLVAAALLSLTLPTAAFVSDVCGAAKGEGSVRSAVTLPIADCAPKEQLFAAFHQANTRLFDDAVAAGVAANNSACFCSCAGDNCRRCIAFEAKAACDSVLGELNTRSVDLLRQLYACDGDLLEAIRVACPLLRSKSSEASLFSAILPLSLIPIAFSTLYGIKRFNPDYVSSRLKHSSYGGIRARRIHDTDESDGSGAAADIEMRHADDSYFTARPTKTGLIVDAVDASSDV